MTLHFYYDVTNLYYNVTNLYYDVTNLYYNVTNLYYDVTNLYYNVINGQRVALVSSLGTLSVLTVWEEAPFLELTVISGSGWIY